MRSPRRAPARKTLAPVLASLLLVAPLAPANAQVEAVRVSPLGAGAAPAVGAAASLSALTPLSLPSAPAAPVAPAALAAAPLAAPSALPSPAAAATAVAAPAAAAARAASPAAAPTSLGGRLARAVAGGISASLGRFFDGAAPAPSLARGVIARPASDHRLRRGVALDRKPEAPDEGAVSVSDFHLAPDQKLADGTAPVVLDADPKDAAAVEKALRALVDSNPAKYGAPSSDMAKVHVAYVPGDKAQGQADTYYAVFRQWKQGTDRDGSPYALLVDGGALTFVVKVLADGKPRVMATEGSLYPGVSSDVMTPGFDDDQLLKIAENRLHAPVDTPTAKLRRGLAKAWARLARAAGVSKEQPPVLLTREITNVKGAWRAVNVYQASDLQGRPVIVGVDVKTGDAFAWSAQDLLRDGGPIASGVAGAVFARGTTLNAQGSDHGPTDAMPLPFANVYGPDGTVAAVTAADGTFTVPGTGTAPVKLTVRLEGTYAKIGDEDGAKNGPVAATVSAVPGQTVRAVLNPDGDALELDADVNGYVYATKQIAWLRDAAGMSDPRLFAPLAGGVRTNRHDMPGNAYYSPTDDSLNLQAAATIRVRGQDGKPTTMSFENTAQPSIIYHEITHRAVQVLSQIELTAAQAASAAYRFVVRAVEPIMDGGVNEAIADTVSMFMRGSPLIGEGFQTDAPAGGPNVIRTGENATQYDPKNPDPHAQGEAYMGFTWTVRRALIAALGEAAGAAYAALVVVPTTLYSQPGDVPTAMLHVLLGDMTTDGRLPHEEIIRAAAKAHGPDLPAAVKGA